jgi:SAM-dependent MidA family methyltransferase
LAHQNGLSCCGLASQAQFLLSLGFHEHLTKNCTAEDDVLKLAMAQARLTHILWLIWNQIKSAHPAKRICRTPNSFGLKAC